MRVARCTSRAPSSRGGPIPSGVTWASTPTLRPRSRDSPALRHRAEELGVTAVRTGVADKAAGLIDLCGELDIPLDAVCYVGDDDPDLPAMAVAGLSAAPADAAEAVRAHAGLVL